MGYKPEGKIYNLQFTDKPGLEVSAKSASLGELTHVQQLNADMQEKDPEKRMEVFRFFADRLIKWNIEHPEITNANPDGTCAACGLAEDAPMPPTVESMLCLELDLIMAIIIGWVFAVARVSVPKEMSLNAGERLTQDVMSQLESLQNPMTLSEQS